MDPVTTWALGVAGAVLGKVLPDLISGKIQAARKEEIAQQVELALQQHHFRMEQGILENIEKQVLLRRIMDEIEILSNRDPDLLMTGEELRLKRRTNVRIPFRRQRRIRNAWTTKLQNLQIVIEQRRRELSTSPAQPLSSSPLLYYPEDPNRTEETPFCEDMLTNIPLENHHIGEDPVGDDPVDTSDGIVPSSTTNKQQKQSDLPSRDHFPDDQVTWTPAPLKPVQGRWAKRLQDLETEITLQQAQEDHAHE